MAWQPIGGLFGQEAQPFGDEVVYRAASKAGLVFQAFAIVCRCCSGQRRVERHTACLFGGCFGWIIFFGGYFFLHGFGVTQVVHVARGVECGQRGAGNRQD